MERKLAAILAADVAGYSRLMGTDEEGTLKALSAHREVVDGLVVAHRGRVFSSAGDSVVAEFPSAVEAINCAVEIQQEMDERNETVATDKRLQFRIGINIGDVMAEGGNVFGDGVNVAARVQELAEPGGICVARNVHDQVRHKVGVAFESLGSHHVKNIAEPVSVYRVPVDGAVGRSRVASIFARLRGRGAAAAAVAAIFLIAAGATAAWYFYPHPQSPSGPPSVAVLPFANMSGDPALDYFADGVTETLIAGLSRSPQIRVIARTSSDAYKGKKQDIRQIGSELGARYVLEGSVQKGAEKMRIVAQLIEGSTGNHVWAERYDREGSDALALQDDVTEKIVGSLAGDSGLIKKKDYEQAWGKARASLGEYDYYLRGHQLLYRFTKEDTLRAVAVWREGLAKYPDSSLLRIKLGSGYNQLAFTGWGGDVPGDYERAFDYIEQGLGGTNVPPLAQTIGHGVMTFLQIEYKQDWDRGLQEREMTMALSPGDPPLLLAMSEVAIRSGRPDDAIAELTKDLPWDVNHPFGSPHWRLGWAYYVKRDYAMALDHLKRERNWDVLSLPILVATHVELGQLTEARAAVAKLREEAPDASVAFIAQISSHRDPATQERFLDALRKAGLPEK